MSARPAVTAVVAVLALAGAAAALVLLDRGTEAAPGDAPTFVSEHPVAVPGKRRTVSLSTLMPMPSAHERTLSAMLESGAMPAGPTTGTVLTDTECEPDERMVSRCRNEVLLDDGSTLVLRHPHDMRDVPCLAPGEEVRILPLS